MWATTAVSDGDEEAPKKGLYFGGEREPSKHRHRWLLLCLDRDSGIIAAQFDERDPAVKALLAQAIKACRAQGKYIGICGQGPSDHPDFAQWLKAEGISSISLNPDSVVDTWQLLAG